MEENKKLKKKDLKYTLDKLYRCRDLEISNLWQRSVFLSVFLILCFTAYGYLAIEILKPDSNTLKYSTGCIFIACVSIIFSIVWILMAKASKAWYEVYENAISEFERRYFSKIKMPEEYIMGNMGFPQTQRNDSIFSSKGGAFSPSRINIAIGQISLYLWIFIAVVHIILNAFKISISVENFGYILITILVPMITLFSSILLLKTQYVKSGFLHL